MSEVEAIEPETTGDDGPDADLEAALEAEYEHLTDPADEPPADEPPADEPEGLSEKEVERRNKLLDNEQKRHTEKVASILGDQAVDVILCPFCEPQLQGFLRPETLDFPRDDMHARMIDVLRGPPKREYRPAPHTRACATCDAEGLVASGSKVPQQETVACPICKGMGYESVPMPNVIGQVGEPVMPAPNGTPPGPLNNDDVDPSGHPRLLPDGRPNPNFGKWPQYVDPNYP